MDAESLSSLSNQLNSLPADVFERLVSGAFDEVMLAEVRRNRSWPKLSAEGATKLTSFLPTYSSSSTSLAESLYDLLVHISRHVVKPKQLQRALLEAGLESGRIELFVSSWKANAGAIVEALKEAACLDAASSRSGHLLKDVSWKLQLLADSSYQTDRRLPLGQLDFALQKSTEEEEEEVEGSSHLSVNFSHSELATFYSSLEAVQAKLDQLLQQGNQQQQQQQP